MLCENWKPSDFNKTKALIYFKELEAESDINRIYWSETIEPMLHFELHLSRDLITEILEDYEQFSHSNKIQYIYRFRFNEGSLNETTTRYVDYDL